jgi:hypothetical protein
MPGPGSLVSRSIAMLPMTVIQTLDHELALDSCPQGGGSLMLSGWWYWGGPAAQPSSWLEIDLRA